MHLNSHIIIAHSSSCCINNANTITLYKYSVLNKVRFIKYLGVFINENLKWDVH